MLISVAIAALLIATGTFVVNTGNAIRAHFNNAYSVWWVADMVIEHMDANNGDWPKSWDELRDDHQSCIAQRGGPSTFEELQSRVSIDWDADPDELRTQHADGTATFTVIKLKDGTADHISGEEPNQKILDYLNDR